MHRRSVVVIRRSQLIGANDRRVLFQCDRSRSRFRLAANVVLAAFLCISLFHILFFFFLFQLRTMLFHLHSLFTSRALHASRLFLFVQLSFFSCPLSCLLVFYVLQSVPYVFFSEFSSPLPCFLSFHLITPNPVSPFMLPIFLKIFHLIRSQA